MTSEEFCELLNLINKMKCETQTLELKSAGGGCPKRLYDTLSSFSNQDDGGVIVFGIDEQNHYAQSGVYDAQDLQKKVNEQCLQMEPVVRPLMTVVERDSKHFVAAEIPGMDLVERPCYYKGQGRLKGSFTRIGDSNEPMTEYEIYSYEAFRRKYQDDIRGVRRASLSALNREKLAEYIRRLQTGKPNLSHLPEQEIYELMSMIRDNEITLSAVLLFGLYPQAYFPQLCITAVVVPGTEMGDVGAIGERFLDNERIEGSIPEMLERALQFVRRNMKTKTIIHSDSGRREDRTDYPMTAVREALINALVHRDYSMHTEGMPIQILMFEDRMEIHNPGGIYGRLRTDQLGKMQPDTRNPVLAAALEVLGITENRYSGIPTIRCAFAEYGMREPVFSSERGHFAVTFHKEVQRTANVLHDNSANLYDLLAFCRTPRTRKEICDHLGLSSMSYAIQLYIMPLVEQGLIKLTIPDKPKSPKQLYYS